MSRSGGRPPSQRQLRVGEELRHALSQILGEGQIRDPELAGISITVTEVRTSPDLKSATAFVMPLGGQDLETKVAALRRAAPFLRGELARRVRLRQAPQLSFEADQSFAVADRVATLLNAERVRRDLRPEGDEEAGEAAASADAGEAEDHGA